MTVRLRRPGLSLDDQEDRPDASDGQIWPGQLADSPFAAVTDA